MTFPKLLLTALVAAALASCSDARPRKEEGCSAHPNCGQCVTNNCGWCPASTSCGDVDPQTDQPRTPCEGEVALTQATCSEMDEASGGVE